MKRTLLVMPLLLACLSASADAAVVTARWGVQGRVQHPGTLKYEPLGKQGTLLVFDLSALPSGATVYGARLFFSGVNWKENGFDIVPAVKADGRLQPAGKRLAPAGPWYQWLDATEAVRAWAKAGSKAGVLWMRNARAFRQDATVLEIAYEGDLPANVPPQVSGVKAFWRSGQVFVTFKEIEPWEFEPRPLAPLEDRKVAANWGELVKKFRGDYYGPLPGGGQDDVRYRIYSHDRPITAANVGQAQLLGEALPGSAFNTRMGLKIDTRRKREDLIAIRAGQRGEGMGSGASVGVLMVAVEPGKPVSLGTGVLVHTVKDEGDRYYAVLTSVNGLANTRDISKANTAGPIRQRPGDPEPVLYKELVRSTQRTKHVQQWYSYWTVQPLSPWPARYDVAVWFCPEIMAKPAPLDIPRFGWNKWPRPPDPRRTTGIGMVPTSDHPVNFRTGLHDAIGTLKGFDGGTWKPFFSNRQAALIAWMCATWPIDKNRISAGLGCWGMQEIKRGDLYARIYGGGLPEVTKGWQAWQRACGIWGHPRMYQGRPDQENPYVVSNVTDWVLAHPDTRLPYCWTSSPGGHEDEMGWPPYPRFIWAMMVTKRAFLYDYRGDTPVAKAIKSGQLDIRRNHSLPAFRHCSLDDNLGYGELGSGLTLCPAQVNGYLLWDTATIADEPTRWEVTIWLHDSAPLPECTVDLTPQWCQKLKAKAGQQFAWTHTLLAQAEKDKPERTAQAQVVQSGVATADRHGLVTIEKLRVTKGRYRIAIRPAP